MELVAAGEPAGGEGHLHVLLQAFGEPDEITITVQG